MSRIVELILENGRGATYDRVKAMKYAVVADELRERGGAAATAADRLETACEAWSEVSLEKVVQLGTPYFWLNIQRLYRTDLVDAGELGRLSDAFLAHAFDSLYSVLPDGAEIELRDASRGALLPRTGLALRGVAGSARLRREAEDELTVIVSGRAETCSRSSIPASWRFPLIDIAGEPSRLLLAYDESLLDPSCFDWLAVETARAPTLARSIAESLETIARVDSGLHARIRETIEFFWPISTPDDRDHNSFSIPRLIGVIFLSERYHDHRLTEALVHEYHHNELSKLLEVDPLFDETDERFYSPWRSDARPMHGLIHAIHVFLGVLDYYRRALETPELAPRRVEFRQRAEEVCGQVRLGLLQVPARLLTPLGSEAVEDMWDELGEHERAFGVTTRGLSALQAQHLERWRAAHPRLAGKVEVTPRNRIRAADATRASAPP